MDGEVRVFEGLDDDDSKTFVVADTLHSIAYREGCFIVGTDTSLVQAFTLQDGNPHGLLTRFTAPPTHIVVGEGGRKVACAASDMTIRIHDTQTHTDLEFKGHKGPVLSVALDPKGEFLASSSCDGTVCIWEMPTGRMVTSWTLLPVSNSFSHAEGLARLAFTPCGRTLAVPAELGVQLYERETWAKRGKLTSSNITKTISVIAISPCGSMLAGGCKDGVIAVWNLPGGTEVMCEKHPQGLTICGLVWHPSAGERQLAFVDVMGQLGTVVEVGKEGAATAAPTAAPTSPPLANGVAEGEDINFLLNHDKEEEEEEEGEYSLSKIKAELGFADDPEGTFIGLPSEDAGSGQTDPQRGAQAGGEGDAPSLSVPRGGRSVETWEPVVQKPFQPGMSPEHLTERYMLWNEVGVIRQYNGEEESSIDVEFHDTSLHHSLHLSNPNSHSMAALSTEALALAAEAQDEQSSKLSVQPLGGGREWEMDMPGKESIVGVAVGKGWVGVGTDGRNLRIFGNKGTQRCVLSIGGALVCMAGCGDNLMVVYHAGVGAGGDQVMNMVIFSMGGGRHPLPTPTPLPLNPSSFLAWAGFTDEGTPMMVDSKGIVRMMPKIHTPSWVPVLDTRSHVRGKSDHYFVVGASERQGNVRAIMCKGARHPPLLPRPHLSLLDMKVLLCEPETEKSDLEEKMIRSSLLLSSFPPSLVKDEEEEEEEVAEAKRQLQEAAIKLFALACRGDRDGRALEVATLMPTHHTMQLAIKYAARLGRVNLAERVGEVMVTKEEEEERRRRTKEEEEFRLQRRRERFQDEEEDEEEEEEEDRSRLSMQQEEEGQGEEYKNYNNPLLEAYKKNRQTNNYNRSTTVSEITERNPFKRKPEPSSSSLFSSSSSSQKSIDKIDGLKKIAKKEFSPILRPVMRKVGKQKKNQAKESNTQQEKENLSTNSPQLSFTTQTQSGRDFFLKSTQDSQETTTTPPAAPSTPSAPPKVRSALQLWLDDHEEEVKEKNPGVVTEKELLLKAAWVFRDLDDEVKQKYKNKASALVMEEKKKRQREEEEEKKEEENEEVKRRKKEEEKEVKTQKGSGISKLSAFVFSKEQ